MSCSLQLWTGEHGKFLASCANFFEWKWTSEMDSADQNTSKAALKRKLSLFCGYGQILGLKFIYIESIHPFYQAQYTVHRWIPTIKCIFQLRTDKIECMAVWETKPCCFCLHPATSDAGNLGQNFTLTNQFLANLKLDLDLGCKKESIAHFSNILLILYRPQWWAWLSLCSYATHFCIYDIAYWAWLHHCDCHAMQPTMQPMWPSATHACLHSHIALL